VSELPQEFREGAMTGSGRQRHPVVAFLLTRRRHPVAALLIGGGVCFLGLVFFSTAALLWAEGDLTQAGAIVSVSLGLVLMVGGGLWCGWQLWTARWGLPPPLAADTNLGRSWEVVEPGTSLMESAGGGEVVMRLSAGTVVVEGERQADFIRVTVLPGNQVGWVERRAVR
jgi:hypothetical protein